MDIITNIVITIYIFSIWYFIGLGPVAALVPRCYQSKMFLLPPLIGMCLLTLIGFFELTVLLTPLTPYLNEALLGLLSLLLCLWRWKAIKVMYKSGVSKPLNALWLIPAALLIVFASLFHHGFHLLVGSSDQLQYCLDAKQILEEMNTGSINDLPIPRHDHYVYDFATRLVSYSKDFRRGADIMLATTKALSGLSFQEAFPVLILCAFLTLGLTLGFLSQIFLRFSIFSSLLLQLIFLSSFYLILIHVQGSLPLSMAIAPNLAALALLLRVSQAPSWRWLLLATIVVAAYLTIYSDVALINLLLPIALMLGWQARRSWRHVVSAIKRLTVVFLLVFVVTPATANAILFRIIDGLHPVFAALLASSHSVAGSHYSLFTFMSKAVYPQWNLAPVILGATSYYDSSAINARVASFIANIPWLSPTVFFLFCGIGVFGLLKNKTPLARFYAIPLILWPLVTIVMADVGDSFRFARSLYYPLPFAMIGLVAITSKASWKNRQFSFFQTSFSWVGTMLLVGFILMNIYTSTRTFYYLASHDVYTDPLIARFDERSAPWAQLRDELHRSNSHQMPILFSGYHDTIRPLIIVSNAPTQEHVLGTSILSFWPIYTNLIYQPLWSDYNTRLSHKALDAALQKEKQYWTKDMVSKMIERSELAVVPVGNGLPIEWLSTSDVYAPRSKRFPNICDVVYRNEYSVILPKNITSSLKKDSIGPYRLLLSAGPLVIKEQYDGPKKLTLVYEGKVGDIKIKMGDQLFQGEISEKMRREISIVAYVQPKDKDKLSLLVAMPAKLRTLRWEDDKP